MGYSTIGRRSCGRAAALGTAVAAVLAAGLAAPQRADAQSLVLLGTYADGDRLFDEGYSEIVAYDPETQTVFSTNGQENRIDRIGISDPTMPTLLGSIDMSPFGDGVNSVAFKNGIGAAAVEAPTATDPGSVVFFTAAGNTLSSVQVGALPDMLTFTPDGQKVLVANEGEPNDAYTIDPEGSVSIIDISGGVGGATVATADFTGFDGQEAALRGEGVRIFGPGASVSEDLEPEYIAVSPDGTTAFAALQENNALAVIDIDTATVTDIRALGFKDHSDPENPLDASDRDDGINIQNWPVSGMPQPDAIATYEAGGETYIVTANEGDARDYDGFSEEARIGDLVLDPAAFPNASTLQEDENLGRLQTTTTLGDTDGDGDFDQIFSYGARSFSIYDSDGNLVFDSADDFEQITAMVLPDEFNSDNDENDSFDSRSDAKGPEPEALAIGVKGGRTLAFVGLERIGGIMVYDITDPLDVMFVDYVNNRDFGLSEDDLENTMSLHLGPEGLLYIPGADSPTGHPLLVAANEVSGTVSIYGVPEPTTLALSVFGLGGLGLLARRRRIG